MTLVTNSDATIIFDQNNMNWTRDTTCNTMFLQGNERHMNNLLLIRGHVLLNDIFDALGASRTKFGALNGWHRDSSSRQIKFDIEELTDGALRIEFNVQGEIYDKLP